MKKLEVLKEINMLRCKLAHACLLPGDAYQVTAELLSLYESYIALTAEELYKERENAA